MGSRGNIVMLEEFKALLEKSLTNKTDRYWLDQVGLEINDENDLCIVVSSDFIKSSIEKRFIQKLSQYINLNITTKLIVFLLLIKTFKKQVYLKGQALIKP